MRTTPLQGDLYAGSVLLVPTQGSCLACSDQALSLQNGVSTNYSTAFILLGDPTQGFGFCVSFFIVLLQLHPDVPEQG